MPRTLGAKTKKLCWRIKIITQIGNNVVEIYNKEFPTLKEAGDEIGLNYHQISEIAPAGRVKQKQYKNFKMMPTIEVIKLNSPDIPVF